MLEKYPSKLLGDAVEAISSLPGVGRRSALRLALHLLGQPQENVLHFSDAIRHLATDAHYCRHCRMISDSDECSICTDRTRDHRTVCVVESVRDVMSIEGTGQYRGVYHVLGGIISPINGIGPSELTIGDLVSRLREMTACLPTDNSGQQAAIPEVILALSGDVEGETTAFYIYRQISALGVKVTTLARGLGFGDDLEYADSITLGRSIINRQLFNPN